MRCLWSMSIVLVVACSLVAGCFSEWDRGAAAVEG